MDNYEQLTFQTGGIGVVSGQQYVAFLSASNFFDGVNDFAFLPFQPDNQFSYAGGGFAFLNNGGDFSLVTSRGWNFGANDTLFQASSPAAVPEPASMILLGTGPAGAVGAARARRKRSNVTPE